MIRTLIFGAIAGYVGKKLYDEGKLTQFKEDLVSRYNQAKTDLAEKRNANSSQPSMVTPARSTSAASSSSPAVS